MGRFLPKKNRNQQFAKTGNNFKFAMASLYNDSLSQEFIWIVSSVEACSCYAQVVFSGLSTEDNITSEVECRNFLFFSSSEAKFLQYSCETIHKKFIDEKGKKYLIDETRLIKGVSTKWEDTL